MRLSPRRPVLRALLAITGLSAGLLTAALAVPAVASAAAANAHDPMGAVTAYRAAPNNAVRMIGWSADPDALGDNVQLASIVDGRTVTIRTATSLPNASVQATYGTGPTPGFDVTIPVPAGAHYVCLDARNVGSGMDTLLKCVKTPVPSPMSSTELHSRDPFGAITAAWANSASVHVRGWATDPDYPSGRLRVVLYVDGSPATTVATTYFTGTRPAGSGYRSYFDILVPTVVGSHIGCLWVVNSGIGYNTYLGCRSMDNRGAAGTGALTTPAVNTAVLTEAKKHINQDYVWGATGPKTFDCSGLVVYSYKVAGMPLSVRTSEQMALQARLIPASRALPGDLVFTHDAVGDVYHVGIYVKPGLAFAAIDTAEGVNYQNIWDPANTTYGSYTHT